MTFPIVAVLIGFAIAIASGGRLRYLEDRPFRLWALIPLGVVGQALADVVPERDALALLVASYVVLLGFAVANVRVAGMVLIAAGILLNMTVVAMNGGMPVRPDAVVAAGVAERSGLHALDLGAKRQLERPGDRLRFLGDIIPVPPTRSVVSLGDLSMAAGVAVVIVGLLRPPGGRSGRRRAADAPGLSEASPPSGPPCTASTPGDG